MLRTDSIDMNNIKNCGVLAKFATFRGIMDIFAPYVNHFNLLSIPHGTARNLFFAELAWKGEGKGREGKGRGGEAGWLGLGGRDGMGWEGMYSYKWFSMWNPHLNHSNITSDMYAHSHALKGALMNKNNCNIFVKMRCSPSLYIYATFKVWEMTF